MNYKGLIIGIFTFLIIGIFHPLVIKAEYYFGKKSWIVFLILGILFLLISLFTENIASILFGVTSFSSFWSIKEVHEQEDRVLRGWMKENPKRADYYENLRNTTDNWKRKY